MIIYRLEAATLTLSMKSAEVANSAKVDKKEIEALWLSTVEAL